MQEQDVPEWAYTPQNQDNKSNSAKYHSGSVTATFEKVKPKRTAYFFFSAFKNRGKIKKTFFQRCLPPSSPARNHKNEVSLENAGLLALTRVGSRRVVQIASGFMIFFSILGKFGAVFASIPAPIIAALYCLFFAYVGAGGLSFLQFCNLNSFRTKFILGFS
ncbi:hypothetical protein F2Q70_00000518 [Brassica cretica]|nr:hypothetical protein F2Q68_00018972 [Brassica cretica]KAF2576210.1 hypothetical protein F2Q70_00000518 [Brassica cretica]